VKPYSIRICVAFPPDTDTPGLQEEKKTLVTGSAALILLLLLLLLLGCIECMRLEVGGKKLNKGNKNLKFKSIFMVTKANRHS